MALDMTSVSLIFLGIVVIIIAVRFLKKPILFLLKTAANTALGGVVLLIINGAGGIFGACVGVNWVTCLAAGVLGIPGVLALYMYRILC